MDTPKQRVQLLASNSISDLEKLAKILTMQLNLIKKLNRDAVVARSSTIKFTEKVIEKIKKAELTPEWRLLTTSVKDEYEFTVSHFKIDEDDNIKEFPLYHITGTINPIKTSMVGAGVDPEEVRNLFIS